MKAWLKRTGRGVAAPIGFQLQRIGIRADWLTVLGVLLALPAGWSFYAGSYRAAFFYLAGSGLCDLLDGAVARARGGKGTAFGAALDSTLDRYGEGVVFGGIVLGLAARGAAPWLLAASTLAGIGSFLVSYVRARAEGLSMSCEVGYLERPERLALLLALALWGEGGARWILPAVALLSHITFVQRLAHVRRQSRSSVGS